MLRRCRDQLSLLRSASSLKISPSIYAARGSLTSREVLWLGLLPVKALVGSHIESLVGIPDADFLAALIQLKHK